MSVESGVVAALSKPLMWVFSTLVGVLITLVAYIWKTQDKKVAGLAETLYKDYYNKEIVDMKIEPLRHSIEDNTRATRELRNTVHELALQVAKNERARESQTDM